MIYEFQVTARVGSELFAARMRAEDAEEIGPRVRELFSGLGQRVSVDVGPGLPVIDWAKPTKTYEEAAVFLGCSTSHVSALMAAGDLPKARNGRPLFLNGTLEGCALRRMGLEEAA